MLTNSTFARVGCLVVIGFVGTTGRADRSNDVAAESLATRGAGRVPDATGLRSNRDLQSLAAATPLSSDDLVRLTAQLHSTLVSYISIVEASARQGAGAAPRSTDTSQ